MDIHQLAIRAASGDIESLLALAEPTYEIASNVVARSPYADLQAAGGGDVYGVPWQVVSELIYQRGLIRVRGWNPRRQSYEAYVVRRATWRLWRACRSARGVFHSSSSRPSSDDGEDGAEYEIHAPQAEIPEIALSLNEERRWKARVIRKARESSNSRIRQTMRMILLHDASIPEMAAAMGCPSGTIKSDLSRLRHRLRSAMDGEY